MSTEPTEPREGFHHNQNQQKNARSNSRSTKVESSKKRSNNWVNFKSGGGIDRNPNSKNNSEQNSKRSKSNDDKKQKGHNFGQVMTTIPSPNLPRFDTVSIALPGSIVSNAQTKEVRLSKPPLFRCAQLSAALGLMEAASLAARFPRNSTHLLFNFFML